MLRVADSRRKSLQIASFDQGVVSLHEAVAVSRVVALDQQVFHSVLGKKLFAGRATSFLAYFCCVQGGTGNPPTS